MPRVAVDVVLKREILDPEGRAVERALPGLGFDGIGDVRVGKHLEFDVDIDDVDSDRLAVLVEQMCAAFLTNPVIESFRWRVIDEHERADVVTPAS